MKKPIRKKFPQVYHTAQGYMVSARSTKLGLNERKTFSTEQEALDDREQILALIERNGAQPLIGKETKAQADLYTKLEEKLKRHSRTPED